MNIINKFEFIYIFFFEIKLFIYVNYNNFIYILYLKKYI